MSAKELGAYLECLRNEKFGSLREAAKHLKISHSYLRNIEIGIDPRTNKEINITLDTLNLLAKGYDVPLKKLIELAGYKLDHKTSNTLFCEETMTYNSNPDDKKFYEMIARAKELPKENVEQISDALEALLKHHEEKVKHKKSQGKTDN